MLQGPVRRIFEGDGAAGTRPLTAARRWRRGRGGLRGACGNANRAGRATHAGRGGGMEDLRVNQHPATLGPPLPHVDRDHARCPRGIYLEQPAPLHARSGAAVRLLFSYRSTPEERCALLT